MSSLTTFEQDLVNLGKKIKAGAETAGEDAGKVLAFLANEGSLITGVASLAGPSGSSIASLGLKLIGLAGKAVEDASGAAGGNAINVPLDQEVINDVKAIIAAVKSL